MLRKRAILFAAMLYLCVLAFASATARADTNWPMKTNVNGYTVMGYQPQATDWQSYKKLIAIMAVSIVAPGQTTPVYGVLNLTADTTADLAAGTVLVSNISVTSTNFPTLSADQQQRLSAFVKIRSTELGNRVIPLDTILLSLKSTQNASQPVNINTTPPAIYYSAKPAILVAFDGDPLFGPIKGMSGDLKFAVNTNWNVFQSGGTYYLLDDTYWLQASSVKGPWRAAGALPAVFGQLPDEENWKEVRARLGAPQVGASQVPIVWIETGQGEAIVTEGAPKLVTISGTSLSYVDNTDAALFYNRSNKHYYYLSSGRWFATGGLSSGTWTFANKNLPADFAKIPSDGPRGWILASVPGSPQAQAAIAAAAVPRVAHVSRTSATLNVTYGGDAQFKPITNTTLQYAVNASTDVLKLGDQYYACDNAVWFIASSPTGPWAVAQSVPPDVYTIPSDQPLYNDTYVNIDTYDQNYVTFGYTAGYMLSYPWYGGLYYGTGWWRAPWVGFYGGYPAYYPWYPRTYVGGTYYNPATGGYARGYGVYGPYGGARVADGYNASTGNYFRGGAVYGPYGGIGHATVYNPSTGNYYHGSAAWGPNGVAYRGSSGNVGYRPYGSGYGGAAVSPYKSWGNAATMQSMTAAQFKPGAGGNVYAGKDGNVYRPSTAGSWQQYNNRAGGWTNTSIPAATTGAGWNNAASRPNFNSTASQLNRDSFARTGGYGGVRGGGGIRGR